MVSPIYQTLAAHSSSEVRFTFSPKCDPGDYSRHCFLVQATAVSTSDAVQREQWDGLPKDTIQRREFHVEYDKDAERVYAAARSDLEMHARAYSRSYATLVIRYFWAWRRIFEYGGENGQMGSAAASDEQSSLI